VSVIRYTETRPFVVRMNDVGGDVGALVPPKRKRRRARSDSDAVVGGGAGGPAAVDGRPARAAARRAD
jgi:hypothetical protein